MTPEDAIALKPCPFCGSVPEQPTCFAGDGSPERSKWGWVECGCGARAPDVRANYKPISDWAWLAAQEWNRRA